MSSDSTTRQRLQKLLAAAGVASRRVCEEYIADGRVEVNGSVARLGDKADPAVDVVTFDGLPIAIDPSRVTYLLNKPVGVVSTAHDPQGRTTVVDLVDAPTRVYPVGRLDADSEGLLLLTNDGALAQRLTHPSFGVDKEYLVSVSGTPSRHALRRLREGIELDDGQTAPARVSQPSAGVLRIVLHEGRNRQIRRMCEAIGHPVTRLVRTRIGPLTDPGLPPGATRPLTRDELLDLERAIADASDRGSGDDQ